MTNNSKMVRICYTNWRGVTELRTIVPGAMSFCASDKHPEHPEPQWYLSAFCCDRQTERVFALKDIHWWAPVESAQEERR